MTGTRCNETWLATELHPTSVISLPNHPLQKQPTTTLIIPYCMNKTQRIGVTVLISRLRPLSTFNPLKAKTGSPTFINARCTPPMHPVCFAKKTPSKGKTLSRATYQALESIDLNSRDHRIKYAFYPVQSLHTIIKQYPTPCNHANPNNHFRSETKSEFRDRFSLIPSKT